MPAPASPLLFPPVLNSPGLWTALGITHGLSTRDFQWLAHVQLATQERRSEQTPPMLAHRILLNTEDPPTVTLAGCFILSATPDDHAVMLYTPFDGLKKFASLRALTEHLENLLDSAGEEHRLLAFLAISQRKRLVEKRGISVTYQLIEGDIFDDQRAVIEHCQQLNAQAILSELLQLPALGEMLEDILKNLMNTSMPGVDQNLTRVSFHAAHTPDSDDPQYHGPQRWLAEMSVGDAVLLHYRHSGWPGGQTHTFSNPETPPKPEDQARWEMSVKTASEKLLVLLYEQMEGYWDDASEDGTSRREFFSQVIGQQALADIMLKRESGIIDAEQCENLLAWLRSEENSARPATLETVRIWEHQANFVELAGTLMISHSNACLYTPSQGLQVLKDYQDLKYTLLSKFGSAGHEDELYGLLSLEERHRFLGFDKPHVSGDPIASNTFNVLFEAIITKQRQNIEYALQVCRHNDGAVDIRALFDKALDIRSMIHDRLLTLETHGRWTTRPTLSDNHLPSMVLADTAAGEIKKFASILAPITSEFTEQPFATPALQRVYLEDMKPKLAHALHVGITGEARLLALTGTLRAYERAIVDAVFNPDLPDRIRRKGLNGFRPDAWSLTLQASGQIDVLPLANCVLLTERGGLDTQHSGRALLWTPAMGLEVFQTVDNVRQTLNRRLLHPEKRLTLLENLSPVSNSFHQRYSLGHLRLISANVLQDRTQSAIDHFLERCEQVRGYNLENARQQRIFNALRTQVVNTNLTRASAIARTLARQQSLPEWLAMATPGEQQLHLELLEQWRNSVIDDKDYLDAMPTLRDYLYHTLQTSLGNRFKSGELDPEQIEIRPALTLAGPALSLVDFALNHAHIAQRTAFTIVSRSTRALPAGLDQQTVKSLLASLNTGSIFANKVTAVLKANDADALVRKLRFIHQLPWQLLQHAHQLKLQQRLSAGAYHLIAQVFDMPDAAARATVQGANAMLRPLELIKTTGAAAIKALGLYLIGPASGTGPQVLYTPYHGDHAFHEFENEAGVIGAFNTPGALQDLLVRRLPEAQQSIFSALFKSDKGQISEITLDSNPVGGNALVRLFNDNLELLPRLLGGHSQPSAQEDWQAAKHLFSTGFSLIRGMLPGKLAYVQFLWQSFKDFMISAEALQDHHWKRGLAAFVAGAAEMISLGRLSLESKLGADEIAAPQVPAPAIIHAPRLAKIRPTDEVRTSLQPFEEPVVALEDLKHNEVDGTFEDLTGDTAYAPIAGKVYPVERPGPVWRIKSDKHDGPVLQRTAAGQLVLDLDRHTVHLGKAMSKMCNHYIYDREARYVLNIEAQGMNEIRARHPEKARMLTQAVDLARYYAFNSLHNMVQLRNFVPGTRLDTFLKRFFDVQQIDADILDKIKKVVVPICNALVDPAEDLMNTDRFVVGSNRHGISDLIAFVLDKDSRKNVHFTEKFFNQQLDWYEAGLTEPFNVEGHAQAATLIHEFAHQASNAVDIASLEARRPFADLISTVTGFGAAMKETQTQFQREALSLATPREELFARWNQTMQEWVSLDDIPGSAHVGKEILKITRSQTMSDARAAFFNPTTPSARIDTILLNADSIAFLICEMGRQLDPVSL